MSEDPGVFGSDASSGWLVNWLVMNWLVWFLEMKHTEVIV